MRLVLASALLASTMTLPALPAFADDHASGDAAAGEQAFRQCRACHSIVADDGTEHVKGGATGPNLWGLPGRTAGTDEGFTRYMDSIKAAGEAGLVWDEAEFVAYVQDPNAYLKEKLGDGSARSGMTFRVRKEEDALNIWAYIASVSPAPES